MAQSSMSGIFTGLCFMSSIATAVNYRKRFRLPACWAGRSTAGGKIVIVTTYDEPADRGYVELLDSANLSNRRVIEVPSEPFHALPLRDGKHALVALANGEMARIYIDFATLVDGGFSTGGTMPQTLIYLNAQA